MKTQRLNAVLEQMKKDDLTQMLVSDPTSIYYLTEELVHPGERLLSLYLNVNGKHKLYINGLFPIHQDLGIEIVYFNDNQNPIEIIAKEVDKNAAMGVDKNWPARFLLSLMELGGGSKFIDTSYIIDTLRTFKDEEEKDAMRLASKLNDQAMAKLKEAVTGDRTEKQLVGILSNIYEDLGADGFSFDPIIGFGANAANPHGMPGKDLPKPGDTVILDIGCVKNNYCSDMTRTVFYKEIPEKGREIFEIVLEANKRAISIIKPGVRFCDIDAAARDYITEKGYGEYFTHRTGHSIGLECHDKGDVSAINTDEVQPGMIFSIEPGIYLSGDLGVRIEDLVLVTEDGCEILNNYTKEICVVG
ncbi:M24 family metallopeptidase [Metaclostridioides mangenotii]|uniref:M24 family metallopeptidase n=1 Tax=Metaclostridioides mangenotii TaxID=1540 RepID=UPI0004827C4E|nr:aminopeptidase P family protein [Clostridioides mangenotii]